MSLEITYMVLIFALLLLLLIISVYIWRVCLWIKLSNFYVYERKSNSDPDQTYRRVKVNLYTKKETKYKGIDFWELKDNNFLVEMEYRKFKEKYFKF